MSGVRTAELDYPLAAASIATEPARPRDSARLLVVRRGSAAVEHRQMRDLPDYLCRGDLLVMNRSRVVPARLVGRRAGDNRPIEGLALGPAPDAADQWLAAIWQSRRLKPGDRLVFEDTGGEAGSPPTGEVECVERDGPHWRICFRGGLGAVQFLERFGRTPLPPYILQARSGLHPFVDSDDRTDYQTIYAAGIDSDHPSVAAPTAGLHFTPGLLEGVERAGVERVEVDLAVGPGTFRPVETEFLSDHPMHEEFCRVDPAARERIDSWGSPRAAGRRIVAVGPTSVRLLESLPPGSLAALPGGGLQFGTRLLIQPGHQFRRVDACLTNFHLPRSTLLALVGAMLGLDRVKQLYALAQGEGYRFYSFGDGMLILE